MQDHKTDTTRIHAMHKHEPAIHSMQSWSVLHLILQWPDFWSQAALLLGRGECIMLTTSCYVQSSFIGYGRCQIWPPEICMTYLFTQDHGPLALFLAQKKTSKKKVGCHSCHFGRDSCSRAANAISFCANWRSNCATLSSASTWIRHDEKRGTSWDISWLLGLLGPNLVLLVFPQWTMELVERNECPVECMDGRG